MTPFRDIVARIKSPDGNPFAVWRAIMNLTNSQPDPSMGFDYAANEILCRSRTSRPATSRPAYDVSVTQDAFDLALGYSDPYAVGTFNCLNQVLIGDDRKQMGAQSFALAAAVGPDPDRPLHGRHDRVSSLYVGVAGRTGSGYYYGSGNSQGNSHPDHRPVRHRRTRSPRP